MPIKKAIIFVFKTLLFSNFFTFALYFQFFANFGKLATENTENGDVNKTVSCLSQYVILSYLQNNYLLLDWCYIIIYLAIMFLKRLVFLIRDWGCPDKYPYGKIGGEDYIRNQLQVRNLQNNIWIYIINLIYLCLKILYKKMEPNEHKELQRIRQNLENCFPNISGFLLPYPGKAVATKETFDGHLNGRPR